MLNCAAGDWFYVTCAYRPFRPGQYWLQPDGLAYMSNGPLEAPRMIRENLTNIGLLMSKDLKTFHRLDRITEPNSVVDGTTMAQRTNGLMLPPASWVSRSAILDSCELQD